jgi:Tfp pilus assembly protein PilZ
VQHSRNVLVVGIDRATFDDVASPLLRSIFEIDRVPGVGAAAALVTNVRFHAVLMGYPLVGEDVAKFCADVRATGSRSADAILGLIASPEAVIDARTLHGDTVDFIIDLQEPPDDREYTICRRLGIHPRRAIRVLTRLEANLGDDWTERMAAQTRDISMSGMFVIAKKRFPVGNEVRFELQMPGDTAFIRGQAVVMRHADPTRDDADGMGLRFVSFSNPDDRARLETGLERLSGRLKEEPLRL